MLSSLSQFVYKIQKPQLTDQKYILIDIKYEKKDFVVKGYIFQDGPQITIQKGDYFFAIDRKCKVFPVFVQQQSQTVVQEIRLYDCEKLNFCVITCKNYAQTAIVYSKLKRQISHKGFHQFYKPLKRLGRGTFSTVYLIEHRFTKIKKAAKIFSNEGQKIQFKGKEAIQNQIKTLRQIGHPNLIKYDGIYQTENLIYLVTEYLSGGTLDEMMKTKLVYTGEFVSKIIRDILQGLNYLDKKHIMHRDVKPDNIIYRKQEDMWVLSDFGLAAKSNQKYIYNKCGTQGYIAPEIMEINQQDPKKYSQQCDIYSLGIIAYTLIIGSLPFHVQKENFFETKIIWDLFDRPQCNDLDTQIIIFLKNLLMKSPKQRYTVKQALQSPFFTDKKVLGGLYEYHERRRKQLYNKILKTENIKY